MPFEHSRDARMTDDTEPQTSAPVTRRKSVGGVYAIRNTVSGRVYVGSSDNIKGRWHGHRYHLRHRKHHASKLQRSWTKHGPQAFTFEILELVNDSDQLFVREQHWIDLLDAASTTKGFNSHPRAGGPRGYKASPETRAKISAVRKGKKFGPLTDEHKAALSLTAVKRYESPEQRRELRAYGLMGRNTPKVFSADGRAKIVMTHKGKKKSPSHAAKLRAILTARNTSPDQKRAVSKSNDARRRDSRQGDLFGGLEAGAERHHDGDNYYDSNNTDTAATGDPPVLMAVIRPASEQQDQDED